MGQLRLVPVPVIKHKALVQEEEEERLLALEGGSALLVPGPQWPPTAAR